MRQLIPMPSDLTRLLQNPPQMICKGSNDVYFIFDSNAFSCERIALQPLR